MTRPLLAGLIPSIFFSVNIVAVQDESFLSSCFELLF